MTFLRPFDAQPLRRREAAAARLAGGGDGGERMAWPRAALVVGGVSLALWAGIVHLALRIIG